MWVALGAILQVVLLLLKAYYAKEDDVKAIHADKAKQISDAIASSNISRINSVVQQLRR